jgi:hypothetical protein
MATLHGALLTLGLMAASDAAMAQSTVALTARPALAALPDGQNLPMWGYACGTASGTGVSCTAMNGKAQSPTAWQPPLIRVPAGPLTITLTNQLSFAGTNVPTSIVIDGQLGGGLGGTPQRIASPTHGPQGTTWPGSLGGIDPATSSVTVTVGGAGYVNPPTVTLSGGSGTGATAVAKIAGGVVSSVVITSPGSGYSASDTLSVAIAPPPCALVPVTSACVLAKATLNATVLASTDGSATFVPAAQVDRVRSFGTEVAALPATDTSGSNVVTLTWANLRPGTYLIHSGTEPSIQHPMGLYGVLVVAETTANTAYNTLYDADVPLLFSEIDPAQNAAVAAAVATVGFDERATYAGPGRCKSATDGTIAPGACYPPAVNYSPRYYLINGTSFDRTNLAASTVGVPTAGTNKNLLLRIVNAGQRLHVPAVVGADMTLLAEDGNTVPGGTRVQSSIPMPPGKTFDATIQPTQTTAGTYDNATLPVYDRQLSLSTNNERDGGMQAYINVGTGAASGAGSSASVVSLNASAKTFYCVAGRSLSVTEASKGLLGGSTGASGVSAPTAYGGGVDATNLVLNADGTFTYTQASTATTCGGSFSYLVNGTLPLTSTIAQCDANSKSAAGCKLGAAPTANNFVVVSPVASRYASPPPGVLAHVTNPGGLALSAVAAAGVNADGSFVASATGAGACATAVAASQPAGATCVAVPYTAKDAQGQTSNAATATVVFLPRSGLTLTVNDGPTGTKIAEDYRWIIEEDRTFWVDPKCQVNSTDTAVRPASCPPLPVESLGYNFHSANMPVIATGCVGTVSCEVGQTLQGKVTACDIGNGACRTDQSASQKTPTLPGDVYLDPNKRYFVSILPGDAINPTISGFVGAAQDCAAFTRTGADWQLYNPADGSSGNCGHEMGGAQIAPGQKAVTINLQEIPLKTAKISVFVFEDDNPLNGENDAGGGVDVLAPNEPGLAGFEIKLFDQAGQLGDNTGQITYDEFNQPVSNSLVGYIDPVSGKNACPITSRTDGLVGMIPTCPKYEEDGTTPSPLAGQAVIANLYPGLYEIQAYPAADRIARGEQWLQTNTLDGGKPHEAFIRPDEPGYFQEFGPGGYHVAIGFANPAIINARKAGYCGSPQNTNQQGQSLGCTNSLTVEITNNHMSRSPDQRTFDSGTSDHYAFTQCFVSVGPADAEDFAFQPCVTTTGTDMKPHTFATFTGMPPGTFKMTVFDQWNDIMLDGLVGTVEIGNGSTAKKFPVTQWRTNLYTRTYIDTNNNGVSDDADAGLALVNTNIRYRDGSIGFFNNTDLNGYAGFNEVFPFMNWLVVDTTQTRFKSTWTHVVYDAGGPVDCTTDTTILGSAALPPCTTTAAGLANTDVRVPLPTDLRVPGGKYCDNADCSAALSGGDALGGKSTGALFPPQAFSNSVGWQGLLGQNTFIEFGVKPFVPGENGGIHGQVVYASTRPFDDPMLLLQLSWEPGIPHATVNLYSKTVDAQGNEKLQLVDTTTTASWDDWAQGFRTASLTTGTATTGTRGALACTATAPCTCTVASPCDGVLVTAGTASNAGYVPNMNCPGQSADSPFFATLKNSKQWLDTKDPATHGSTHSLAYASQFKCYDGWSQLNQAQPAPYDGFYAFPSILAIDPATGKPSRSNCHVSTTAEPWGCTVNPDTTDPIRAGTPMLPAGDYVVEVIPPTGYEMVKEEDKNILMGDVYVAPATQQFAGFGNIFIMPDQAQVGSLYNASNPGNLNTTNSIGSVTFPRHEGDTGSVEAFWPCVGALRQVPDYNSEFPGAAQAAPFAGAMRRLCDRKLVTIDDQGSTLAKFYLFSSTHIAGHFTGTITNDFASEFDPFSPQFGEKFGPPNLPVGLRDFNGNEVARVYSDQWGIYNGLYFSTWSPNPPNPTGYAPQMSIACMNDPGPIMVNNVSQTDPSYNPAYSNFCYEQPFMPGETTYMDTPVIPTQAFADGYNLPDTEYPDLTPAIKTVVNTDSAMPQGPWVRPGSTSASAAASFNIQGVNRCQAPGRNGQSRCANPSSLTFPNGTVTCTYTGISGPDCSGTGSAPTNQNLAFADYIRSHIVALMGAGYTASGVQANVIVTAPAAGPSYNGTTVVADAANLNRPTAPVVLADGSDSASASLGLTITALGDKAVQNPHFAGPNATTAPYNQKTITRHYGFGSGGSAVLVAPDGTTTRNLQVGNGNWSDLAIRATVPGNLPSAFDCKVQQAHAPNVKCGQLVITRADNGKRSIDAITVTIGGSKPWVVTEQGVTDPDGGIAKVKDFGKALGRMNLVFGATNQSPIQVAVDSAAPGDLILVQPGSYRENLIMWKPVRLQGVGASAVSINADAHPAGHMDEWRRQMVCVFGLTLQGIPNLGNSQLAFDPSGQYTCPDEMFLKGDRIPFEAITGWQAAGNGNLAQVLQEPTLLGAYEGAGITVVGRGIREPAGSTDFWGNDPTAAGAFPDGAVYLSNRGIDCAVPGSPLVDGTDYGTSNYRCSPSSIDGLAVLNSSQGGGGVFVHGWAHNLDIANTRISANHGTLAGAINLGNGETPPVFVNDGTTCNTGVAPQPLCPPLNGTPSGATIPFGFNTNVRIHNNMLWNNASIGDALFTGTPAGAGGVTVSAGGDSYSIDHNWIAGNLTTGDGGGIQSLGVTFNGTIANNVILFNQSTNPTLPTNGGGIVVQGANEPRTFQGTECGGATDFDCPPGLGDGVGNGLVIDANLIYGNSAESGTGGGVALEQINGSEVIAFPTKPGSWYGVAMTNNIIANNVAGYDGGGVSMRDALKVSLVNNTIASNDTTASAGVLFKTLGAINASSPPPGCNAVTDPTAPQDPSCLGRDAPHDAQPSGLVTMAHTQNMNDSIAALQLAGQSLTCPATAGFGYTNGDCKTFSRPLLKNDMFWQNRTFHVDIDTPAGTGKNTGLTSQQNLVVIAPGLISNGNTPLPAQTTSGQCTSGAFYWDIGLRTDDVTSNLLSAANNKLAITYSILTGAGDIGTAQETVLDPSNKVGTANPVIAQICNGARMPPEHCSDAGIDQNSATCHGFNAPAGASESTSTPTLFLFTGIQPTATVDEGHNWLNLTYGPLTLAKPRQVGSSAGEQMVAGPTFGSAVGAYSIQQTSAAYGNGSGTGAPNTDFFGTARVNRNDIGAVQYSGATVSVVSVQPTTLSFSAIVGQTSATQSLTLTNSGNGGFAIPALAFTTTFSRNNGGAFPVGAPNCGANLAAGASCTIKVQFAAPAAAGTTSGTLTIAGVYGSPVALTGIAGPATLAATVSPATLAFGNVLAGSTSATQNVTVTNTGNAGLVGLAYVFGGVAPQPFSRVTNGAFPVGAPNCGGTLAVGAACTVKIQFAPATGTGGTAYSRSLAVTGTGATITPSTVTLTGASVTPAPVSITPTPRLTITLPTGVNTGTGQVTFTNTATTGGSSVTVSAVAVAGGTGYSFGVVTDNCTGVTLAPSLSCTVTVSFTNTTATRGPNRGGTITFTDTGAGSPQTGALRGIATP